MQKSISHEENPHSIISSGNCLQFAVNFTVLLAAESWYKPFDYYLMILFIKIAFKETFNGCGKSMDYGLNVLLKQVARDIFTLASNIQLDSEFSQSTKWGALLLLTQIAIEISFNDSTTVLKSDNKQNLVLDHSSTFLVIYRLR